MNFMKKIYFTLFAIICFCAGSYAQNEESTTENDTTSSHLFNNGIDYQVRAFFSIGGSAPLGFPEEIRKIEGFNPNLQLGLAVNMTKWIERNPNWGVRIGLKVEGKGMETKSNVKNYYTSIIQDNSEVRGYFTGLVTTEVKNVYVTIPINAVYKLTERWNLYGGFYFSVAIDKKFKGHVSDGYLRENTPVGTKLTFEEGSSAPFNFSKEVKKIQWGAQVGAEWNLNTHFILFPEVTYGISGLLNNDFSAISFSLHNIYLNLGFGYQF